ncbi:beta-lactamase domain protein [Candidatus Vecturithrix granuli]|uniref:Beta-lactamase domain protein n=1 Tax=Vecturithrix granuli TaxID=1499967 RepID=A0A081BZR1_VECG1|nr:beta-lactamase domain protein [Candidatus Vecturithrix granuli]
MQRITLLGTSGAVSNAQRDNVSLIFSSQQEQLPDFHILLECGGSAAHKLAKIGIRYEMLQDVIITHTHLDHLYGLPGLIFSIMYRDVERTAPFRIYCPEGASEMISRFLDFFELRKDCWFPLEIHGIPEEEQALVLENVHVIITSTPVNHAPTMPTYGVKILSKISGKSVVYSSDTTYSERLIRLAKGADLLLHECGGLSYQPIPPIHSNAVQVGKVASETECKKLVLLHLDTVLNDEPQQILDEIRQHFPGESVIASDFDEYVLQNVGS